MERSENQKMELTLLITNIVNANMSVIMNESLNYLEEESDEEEEMLKLIRERKKRVPPPRIGNYLGIIRSFDENQFKMHFRISIAGFEILLQKIALSLKRNENNPGRPVVEPRKQLLSVLWLLATPDSYRSIADRFGIGKSTLWDSFYKVIKCIIALAPEIITWPSHQSIQSINQQFYQCSGNKLHNVLGAVDGSYIPIKAPSEHAEAYVTRKCNYAITLQAICDSNLKFIDCYAGWPGSVSDRRIFTNSIIYKNIMKNPEKYFPNRNYIVGDKAYPVLNWCITPYIDRGNLNDRQIRFNIVLSRVRQTIERAFALLKGRFRRLFYLDMERTDLIPDTILACCVLHNMCLDCDPTIDVITIDSSDEENENNSDTIEAVEDSDGISFQDMISSRM